jgi:hypothetical protein
VKLSFDPEGLLNPDKIFSDRPNPWWSGLSRGPVGGTEADTC